MITKTRLVWFLTFFLRLTWFRGIIGIVSFRILFFFLLIVLPNFQLAASLPFETVFQGQKTFDRLVVRAQSENWSGLPIGLRTATVGLALRGIPYKGFTLEIDDHIEAPSVNLNGLDCWTFFEASLAFARMISEPRPNWTPQRMLQYIELDRYRNGKCNGNYLSRLHYLEDWLWDNDKRGLVDDLTRRLGGVRVRNMAREMTVGWKSYRYLRNNSDLREGIARHEARIAATPFYHIPKNRIADIEKYLQSGDIIGITSRDGAGVGTSHVGLALRGEDGVVRFMHASAPRNHGKVVIDKRISDYVKHYSTNAGILVARPLR